MFAVLLCHSSNELIMTSGKDLESFWGDEITVEEFDFLQSQVISMTATETATIAQPETISQNLKQEINYFKEKQDVQDGQIKMLRAALALRSKELDEERLDRERILQDRLQKQHDKEILLQRNIERLQSELKFKDQELRCISNRRHELELKLKQQSSVISTSVSVKNRSPKKEIANSSFSFHEKPMLISKDTQTNTGKRISFHRTAALIEGVSLSDAPHIFSHANVTKMKASDARLGSVTSQTMDQRVFPHPGQNWMWETISLANRTVNLSNSLHLNCYCTVESENKFRHPEIGLLQQVHECVKDYISVVSKLYSVTDMKMLCSKTGHCNKCLKVIYSQPDSYTDSVPKEVFSNKQMFMIATMKELANLISVSKISGKILLEKWKKEYQIIGASVGNKNFGEKENEASLLKLLTVTTVPLSSSGELINKLVIEWVLTVFHSLTTYTCMYCLKSFDGIANNLCLNVLLEGTCGEEISYMALKFLYNCLPSPFMEPFLGHHSEPCILGSIAKFYNQLSLSTDLTENQHQCYIPLVIDFLTRLIVNHSSIVCGITSNCICFKELLEAIIMCLLLISRKNVNMFVLRKGLHFLHLVSKVFPRFQELRNRVDDEYVMLICHASTLCKREMKDIVEVVHDLWDFRQDESKEFYKDELKAMDVIEIE